MDPNKGFFDLLRQMAEQDGTAPAISVTTTTVDIVQAPPVDLTVDVLNILQRALAFRRTSLELRQEARRAYEAGDRYELECTKLLQQFNEKLAAQLKAVQS